MTDLADHLPAVGSDHADVCPMVGDRREVDSQLRPFRLEPALEPGHDVCRPTAGGVHQIVVLAEPGSHPVVHHHAVFAQHKAVSAATHLEVAPVIGIYAVEELGGVRPLYVDSAQCRLIDEANTVSCREALAVYRIVHRLARTCVVTRVVFFFSPLLNSHSPPP